MHAGIAFHPYNDEYVKLRRTSMTLLKDLGFGRRYVETRIGVELDTLVEKIRKLDGHPFDPNEAMYQCNNGVIMSFMFGRQFDYDNDPLMQEFSVYLKVGIKSSSPELNLFPIVRILPKYKKQIANIAASQT
jgi:cytochrome P450 family 2 subfamily C